MATTSQRKRPEALKLLASEFEGFQSGLRGMSPPAHFFQVAVPPFSEPSKDGKIPRIARMSHEVVAVPALNVNFGYIRLALFGGGQPFGKELTSMLAGSSDSHFVSSWT